MAKTILICDKAALMRGMAKDILTKNGYAVIGEAENGKTAIEKFRALSPDLVLMEISMPDVSGIQLLREIRTIDPGAKVVMCTAMSQEAMLREAVDAGATGYITKPFRPEELLGAVKKVIG